MRARLHGLALILALAAGPIEARELRVCADPNNLPFSNARREGFENKLVEMIAADQGATVSYVWWAQRRGNVRETLQAGRCDIIPGVSTRLETLATTIPYYRSSYMFVRRADQGAGITTFDDARLRTLRVGVQMIGDDGANTPPAHALSRRGIVENVRGYLVYGDYRSPAPQAPIVEAVARGEIDVALVWGPVAGWFAARSPTPLHLTQTPAADGPDLPMRYDVSLGVRKDDQPLRRMLDAWIRRNARRVNRLLADYHVPLVQP